MGLTTALLNDQLPIDNLLQATTVPGLSVLTTGPLPPKSGGITEFTPNAGNYCEINRPV